MKLSVLIPTHNYKCYTLVADLHKQLEQSGIDYEIIVADDGSSDLQVLEDNRKLASTFAHVRLVEMDKSLSRSAMRNRLWRLATYDWQLQINSNVMVTKSDFIRNYLDSVDDRVQIVCGACTAQGNSLRDVYERHFYEHFDTNFYNSHPYSYFRNTNCMFHRSVFLKCHYDETLTGYGHEDSVFGDTLKKADIKIKYIANPVTYVDTVSSTEYLQRTRESLHSLLQISQTNPDSTNLLKVVRKLDKFGLSGFVRLWHRMAGAWEADNLCGANPNMKVYALYKLGYYLSIRYNEGQR